MCQNPDVVQPLREEIINVLKEEGCEYRPQSWKLPVVLMFSCAREGSKVSLYKMKLLDSFMKETQRLQASHGNGVSLVSLFSLQISY